MYAVTSATDPKIALLSANNNEGGLQFFRPSKFLLRFIERKRMSTITSILLMTWLPNNVMTTPAIKQQDAALRHTRGQRPDCRITGWSRLELMFLNCKNSLNRSPSSRRREVGLAMEHLEAEEAVQSLFEHYNLTQPRLKWPKRRRSSS